MRRHSRFEPIPMIASYDSVASPLHAFAVGAKETKLEARLHSII
jgi:hypothetical protein